MRRRVAAGSVAVLSLGAWLLWLQAPRTEPIQAPSPASPQAYAEPAGIPTPSPLATARSGATKPLRDAPPPSGPRPLRIPSTLALVSQKEAEQRALTLGYPGPLARYVEPPQGGGVTEAIEWHRKYVKARQDVTSLPHMRNESSLVLRLAEYRTAAEWAGASELAAVLSERERLLRAISGDGEVPVHVVQSHGCALVDAEARCPLSETWPGCAPAEMLSAVARRVCDDPSSPSTLYEEAGSGALQSEPY